MRLINYISLRLSLIAAVVLGFWSVFFYFAIIDEINDEVDDSLEDYAELVIRRALAGDALLPENRFPPPQAAPTTSITCARCRLSMPAATGMCAMRTARCI